MKRVPISVIVQDLTQVLTAPFSNVRATESLLYESLTSQIIKNAYLWSILSKELAGCWITLSKCGRGHVL